VRQAHRDVLLRFSSTHSPLSPVGTQGETFPWSHDSEYVYLRQNHNSVLGIREYALSRGATYKALGASDLAGLAARPIEQRPTSSVWREMQAVLYRKGATCHFLSLEQL